MEKFREFESMALRLRPIVAAFRTNFVDREGWNEMGIKPRVQSLQNHVETMLDMLRYLSPQDTDTPHLASIIEIHDLQEVITSDFTWDDPITKAEKVRLERLAINIIFENQPEKIALWEEYTTRQTAGALWLSDIDKLECILEFEEILSKRPDLRNEFNRWKEAVGEVLKTDRGVQVFNYIDKTSDDGIALCNKNARVLKIAHSMTSGPA